MSNLNPHDMWAKMKKNSDGLVPAITVDYENGEVLMMAYMNEEAFWKKGETSGHFQKVMSASIDCDRDTLLYKIDQTGAACHTGNRSCFYTSLNDWDPASDKEE